jgi:hypothetical protein
MLRNHGTGFDRIASLIGDRGRIGCQWQEGTRIL